MISAAVFAPMPGSASSSATDAVLMLTVAAEAAGFAAGRAAAAGWRLGRACGVRDPGE